MACGNTSGSTTTKTLLGEVLALRTILLNLHFAVAKGETITAEGMQAINIDRADAEKAKKAAEGRAALAHLREALDTTFRSAP